VSDENAAVSEYAVDLLYPETPLLSAGELEAALSERCGTVEAEPAAQPRTFAFRFPDLGDPGSPAGISVRIVDSPAPPGEIAAAAAQTRDWPQAQAAAARHRARLTLADVRSQPLPYKNRLRLFQDALAAVHACAAPGAILWRPSGKLVNPDALSRAKPGEKRDAIWGAVNVRLLPVPGQAAKMVMDTLGLAALGLPDLECMIRTEDPLSVEAFLLSLARYEFDLGDVLPDGRVVRGPAGDRYALYRARATRGPERQVISLRTASGPPTGETKRFT